MKKLLALALGGATSLTFAVDLDNQAINAERQFIHKNEKTIEYTTKQNKQSITSTKKSLNLNSEQLLANPNLLKLAMQSVLINQQIDAIDTILPLYQQLPDALPVFIDYAKALKLHSLGNYKQAIDFYRKAIAINPNLKPARLNLAFALHADQQDMAALDQLHKLLSENPKKSVATFLQKNINNIKQQQQWQFNLNFYYRHEKNINNAPKSSQKNLGDAMLMFAKPETANGIHLDLDATKKFYLTSATNASQGSWKNNIYTSINLNSSYDYYWDNKKYNDYIFTLGLGAGYADSNFTLEIQPFTTKRLVDNKQYSLNMGASLYLKYRINNNWNISNFNQYSHERIKDVSIQDGNRLFNAISISLTPNATQFWMLNLGRYQSQAKYPEDSYKRYSISLIYAQEWNYGISTNLNLSIAYKKFAGKDFFNIKRKDREYNVKLSVWNRAWHIWNITPRLVFSTQRTKSNHFYYDDRRENNIRLEFSKLF